MLSVRGTFRKGVAQPVEPVEGRDGEPVIISFLEGNGEDSLAPMDESAWDALENLIRDCAAETGIRDLAQQHDHYLYGKPKEE